MDIYLTSKTSGSRLRIPLLPDRLAIKTGATIVSVSIIQSGEVRYPRGSSLDTISWTGVFPGSGMQDVSFVYDWQEPQKLIAQIREWEAAGETLQFMATELSINIDVFIESFSYEYYGVDNAQYNISLTQRRELTISTVAPPGVPESGDSTQDDAQKQFGVVTGGSVYYRKGPGKSYKAYGTKHRGDELEILEKSGSWYKFAESSVSDGYAWIHSKYIKLSSASADKTASKETTPTSSESTYTVRSGDSLYAIAKKKLGSGSRYTEIYALNKTAIDAANKGKSTNKYTIYTGMVLGLPAK